MHHPRVRCLQRTCFRQNSGPNQEVQILLASDSSGKLAQLDRLCAVWIANLSGQQGSDLCYRRFVWRCNAAYYSTVPLVLGRDYLPAQCHDEQFNHLPFWADWSSRAMHHCHRAIPARLDHCDVCNPTHRFGAVQVKLNHVHGLCCDRYRVCA